VSEVFEVVEVLESYAPPPAVSIPPARSKLASLWQIARFGLVGVLNTLVDVTTLNVLLWRFPLHQANQLLLYNSAAYSLGALCSFVLNKYWTFRSGRVVSVRELARFILVVAAGFLCNDGLIWLAGTALHPLVSSTFLWANLSKASAAVGTACVSYVAMRSWVFTRGQESDRALGPEASPRLEGPDAPPFSGEAIQAASGTYRRASGRSERGFLTGYSLSVILPAHNEEAVIAQTLYTVIKTLAPMVQDFEIIVVNDGSKDQTGLIVGELAMVFPRVRLITHPINQGYGAALVTGFEAATKDLAFFMDSDGQFDIADLGRFFPLIERYDAVLGYRIDRQDAWMRKLNAWGWKMLVRTVFGLRVRDIDCAFKLYRADFFRTHRLETRGAMINTEMIYKFTRAGYTYTETGVRHLPRLAGRATGAKLSVIARAFRELAFYARKWHREERGGTARQYRQGFERVP
jgi:putative flippase GtrA